MADHRIILKREGEGFAVVVEPPLSGESFDTQRATYKEARGWAGGLRLTHRWPIEDRTLSDGETRP